MRPLPLALLVLALAGCNLDFARHELDASLETDLERPEVDADDTVTADTPADSADTTSGPDVVESCAACGPLEICCEVSAGVVCTNLATDRDHCGGCGQACADAEVCHMLECCRPLRCETQSAELCGTYADGCGGAVTCECQAPLQCGLQSPNRCAAVERYRIPDSATLWCISALGLPEGCPSPGDPAYGQDGNYVIRPPSWHLTDDIATDLVSGLQWARQPGAAVLPYAQAASECDASTLGGYEDWRLPTLLDLATVLDHGKAARLYDEAVFPTPLGTVLSSTGAPTSPIAISMDTGDINDASQGTVLCVRGSSPTRTWIAGSGVAEDASLGLMWTTTALQTSWNEALAECEALEMAGHSDWRLPALRELVSLVEELSGGGLGLDPNIFLADGAKDTWSATPIATDNVLGTEVWALRFEQIESFRSSPGTARAFFCVRNTDLTAPDMP